MRILRNFRIDIIIEINYNNCFYVVENIAEVLEIVIYYNIKPGWFKKSMIMFITLLITIFIFSVGYITLANMLKVLELFENLGNIIIILFVVFYVTRIPKPVILIDKIITVPVTVF